MITAYLVNPTPNYAGNYIYKKGNGQTSAKLTFFNSEEGYIEPQFDPVKTSKIVGYNYTYQYKDHLGNIRLSYEDMDGNGVISPETEIKEENHYYPFGLKHKGYNNVISGRDHNYGYNGIEESNELGNNMLEMDMRQYDAAIACWVVIDPVTHHDFSPYQAFDNNPIFWADPSGADAVDFAKDLFNRSDSGTTWRNNNDGTFSDGNGNNVNASDNSEGDTDSSEEDCCPWLDRKIDQQLVIKEAIKKGEDPRKAWEKFKKLTGDTEIGEATKTAIIEVGFLFVGEWAFVKVFQGGAWVYKAYRAKQALKGGKFIVDSNKFKYFFGKVITGNPHNVARSAQNLKDLTTLGIKTEAQLMEKFAHAYANGAKISSTTNSYGTIVTKSVNIANKGRIDVSFFYQGGNMAATPSITTIIPKIFR